MVVAFGLGVAILITLAGPLLLFNPWFTSVLQERHGVAQAFDTTQAEVDRVTGELLGDLYADGPFDAELDAGQPLLDADERSHMHDVSRLVRILAAISLGAAVVAVASGIALRGEPRRRGLALLVAGGAVGTVAILLAGTFAVAFEPAFLAFHEIFFPPGTYLFAEGSDLITLFPEGFWFDAALAAGATIILAALLASVLGLRAWRGTATSPAHP